MAEKKRKTNRTVLAEHEFAEKVDLVNASENCVEAGVRFFNIEISDVTLENKSMIRADLSYSKFSNVTFREINFEGAEFNFTELSNVHFFRCKLRRGGFDYSVMKNVTFEECWLDSCSFDFAEGGVLFNHCKTHGMELHHTLAEITLTNCAGEAIEINYCPALVIHAENCDFHRGGFMDGTFSGRMEKCILSDADFIGSDCTQLVFKDCKMRDVGVAGSTGINIVADNDEDFDFDFEMKQ